MKLEVGKEGGGGGMVSLGGGRQKLMFSLALLSLRDSRWYTAGCPSLQKLKAWVSSCWTKFWDEGVQGPGPCIEAVPGPAILGGRDSRSCGPSSCAWGKPPLEGPGAVGARDLPYAPLLWNIRGRRDLLRSFIKLVSLVV